MKKKRKGLKILLAVASMALIAGGTTVALTPASEEYKDANVFKKIENKISNTTKKIAEGVKTATNKVTGGIKTAKDYTKATTYVLKHQDEVKATFIQYENGEISAQEMVDEIASKIDVDYVYDFIKEYAPEDMKQKIKDYAEELEKSGINIDQYLPEEAREELFK